MAASRGLIWQASAYGQDVEEASQGWPQGKSSAVCKHPRVSLLRGVLRAPVLSAMPLGL